MGYTPPKGIYRMNHWFMQLRASGSGISENSRNEARMEKGDPLLSQYPSGRSIIYDGLAVDVQTGTSERTGGFGVLLRGGLFPEARGLRGGAATGHRSPPYNRGMIPGKTETANNNGGYSERQSAGVGVPSTGRRE